VASLSGEQAPINRAKAAKAAERFMKPQGQQILIDAALTARFSPARACRTGRYPPRTRRHPAAQGFLALMESQFRLVALPVDRGNAANPLG
jgi:hypothetical protein